MNPSLSHIEYARASHDARVDGAREAYDRARLVRSVKREPFGRRKTR